jgi:group II intron reverse transcriptase/maturase
VDKTKSFAISKRAVWDAYRKVRDNKGAAGVDEQSLAQFEQNLQDNLYKLWNRMASGSYFPPPVKLVEIPKKSGGVRPLGVPTVADRIAQTVAAQELEKVVEPIFDPDSYAYRQGRSAHDALAVCRQRCWQFDWAIDLDVKAFFDSVDHSLLLKAVEHHTDQRWVLLYVQRWLQAPLQQQDGTLVERDRGTPQGSAVSPVLANLFLHYAFDAWMRRTFPSVPFERYADDVIAHCASLAQAEQVLEAIQQRLAACGLQLHPDKTRIVYCKDGDRSGSHEHESFDFLGYTFRARRAKSKDGRFFISFLPAVSDTAAKAVRQQIRRWRLHLWTSNGLRDIAAFVNPIVRGWINYYGRFYRSRLVSTVLRQINEYLIRWAMRKYKRLRHSRRRAVKLLARIARSNPDLFVHWRLIRPGRTGEMGAG